MFSKEVDAYLVSVFVGELARQLSGEDVFGGSFKWYNEYDTEVWDRHKDIIKSSLSKLRVHMYEQGYSIIQAPPIQGMDFCKYKLNCNILDNMGSLIDVNACKSMITYEGRMRVCIKNIDIASLDKSSTELVPCMGYSKYLRGSEFDSICCILNIFDSGKYVDQHINIVKVADVLSGEVPCCSYKSGSHYFKSMKVYDGKFYFNSKKIYDCYSGNCSGCYYNCPNKGVN